MDGVGVPICVDEEAWTMALFDEVSVDFRVGGAVQDGSGPL